MGCSVASLGAQKAEGWGPRLASHVDGTVMPSGRLVPFFTELNTAPVQGSEGLKEAGQWQRKSLQAWLPPHPRKVSPQTCDRR